MSVSTIHSSEKARLRNNRCGNLLWRGSYSCRASLAPLGFLRRFCRSKSLHLHSHSSTPPDEPSSLDISNLLHQDDTQMSHPSEKLTRSPVRRAGLQYQTGGYRSNGMDSREYSGWALIINLCFSTSARPASSSAASFVVNTWNDLDESRHH